jgi:hypothetical protein
MSIFSLNMKKCKKCRNSNSNFTKKNKRKIKMNYKKSQMGNIKKKIKLKISKIIRNKLNTRLKWEK